MCFDSHWVRDGVHLGGSFFSHLVDKMSVPINHRYLIPPKD